MNWIFHFKILIKILKNALVMQYAVTIISHNKHRAPNAKNSAAIIPSKLAPIKLIENIKRAIMAKGEHNARINAKIQPNVINAPIHNSGTNKKIILISFIHVPP